MEGHGQLEGAWEQGGLSLQGSGVAGEMSFSWGLLVSLIKEF